MFTWFSKIAKSDKERIQHNIARLEELFSVVHELSHFVFAAQGGAYDVLKQILDDKLVLGRPYLHAKIKSALTGENNQKLVLDSPNTVKQILIEAEDMIASDIAKEKESLRIIEKDVDKITDA